MRGCCCCLQENTSVSVPLAGNDLGGGAGTLVVVVVIVNVIISLVEGNIQLRDVTPLLLVGVNVNIAIIRMPACDIVIQW